MATFRGEKNIVHGVPDNDPEKDKSIRSSWDGDSRGYVVEVSGEALKTFRSVAQHYGYTEDGK